MSDTATFIYGIFFFVVAGASFAFMWKSMTFTFTELNKPIKRNVHPEMEEVQSGDELLVFRPEDDDEDDVIIIRK
tara:strand:- start:207 stop:431 length:225 start_codon:yes stop_codon:yes gene_type:complete